MKPCFQWVFCGWRSWQFGLFYFAPNDYIFRVYRWVFHFGPFEVRRLR